MTACARVYPETNSSDISYLEAIEQPLGPIGMYSSGKHSYAVPSPIPSNYNVIE